jgi:putative hemolysin
MAMTPGLHSLTLHNKVDRLQPMTGEQPVRRFTMTQIACIRDTGTERRLQAERLIGAQALQQAQALRFNVFSGEFNAKLKGAELGLDMDDYDVHCNHIGVRDLNTGRLVATTRLLESRPTLRAVGDSVETPNGERVTRVARER